MNTSFTTVSFEATGSDRALVRLLWCKYLAQSVGKLWRTAHLQTQIYWLTSVKHNDVKNACDLSWWNSCLEGVLNFDYHVCWQMNVLEGIGTWAIFPQAWFDPPSFTSRAQSGSSVPTDTVSPPSGSSDALQLIPTSVRDFSLRMRPSRSAEYPWITWWWRNEDTSDG